MDIETKREIIRTYLLRYVTGRLTLVEAHDDTVKLLFRVFDLPYNNNTASAFRSVINCTSHSLPVNEQTIDEVYQGLTLMQVNQSPSLEQNPLDEMPQNPPA